LRCGLLMSAMMTRGIGSGRMGMKTGSSMRVGSCIIGMRASMICRSRSRRGSFIGRWELGRKGIPGCRSWGCRVSRRLGERKRSRFSQQRTKPFDRGPGLRDAHLGDDETVAKMRHRPAGQSMRGRSVVRDFAVVEMTRVSNYRSPTSSIRLGFWGRCRGRGA
jgi:hypothetical protein